MKVSILLVSFCLAGSLVFGQSAPSSGPRLEIAVNPLMLAYWSPNLGLRLDSRGNWDPEFNVAVQLPLLRNMDVFLPMGEPFTNLRRIGGTFYAGISKSQNGFGQRGFKLTLQIGVKGFDTGVYEYRAGLASGQSCGKRSHTRITAGPRVLFAHRFRPGKHAGIEMYAGAGARVGINRREIYEEGWMEQDTYCRPDPSFEPHTVQTLSVPVTLHMGFNVVFH